MPGYPAYDVAPDGRVRSRFIGRRIADEPRRLLRPWWDETLGAAFVIPCDGRGNGRRVTIPDLVAEVWPDLNIAPSGGALGPKPFEPDEPGGADDELDEDDVLPEDDEDELPDISRAALARSRAAGRASGPRATGRSGRLVLDLNATSWRRGLRFRERDEDAPDPVPVR